MQGASIRWDEEKRLTLRRRRYIIIMIYYVKQNLICFSEMGFDYEEDECYVCYDDSLKYLKDFSSVFSQDKDRSPLFYWEAHAGQWPELWFDTYDVDRDIYGDGTPPFREFGDTIKIPIYFSRGYNKLCGYNEYAKLPLGELTFVKRKQ